jgi:dolichyl-phosphate beta-glucosyltransferase
MHRYLTTRGQRYEIIVVDDGSSDTTAAVVTEHAGRNPNVRLLSLERNSGKGIAVRTGVLSARGEKVLFADADGSTPIGEVERLESALERGADIAIGSRAIPSAETHVATVWYRRFLGRLFNGTINCIVLPGLADTQCGFKLFRRSIVPAIFSRQTATGFSFDVEILLIARRLGLRIAEIPVNWTNVPGSKVNLVTDGTKMLRDALIFRWRHRHLRANP